MNNIVTRDYRNESWATIQSGFPQVQFVCYVCEMLLLFCLMCFSKGVNGRVHVFFLVVLVRANAFKDLGLISNPNNYRS